MHQTCQELIRRQGDKPERKDYQELAPGTPVYVQHKPNDRWYPATIVSKADAPNSYWIECENGTHYRHTRSALKVRSIAAEGEQIAQNEE